MKRRIYCFLLTLACLTGCGNQPSNLNQDEIVYMETSTVDPSNLGANQVTTGNVLLDARSELSDVRGDMGGDVTTGQSEIIRVKKTEFKQITESELAEYVESHNHTVNDWFAIVFDDETALIFQNHLTRIVYGTWDEESGIKSTVAVWERGVNEEFPYGEWMKIINEYGQDVEG